jgi:thiol-disulfide isomerase/thioredoxin
MSTIYKFEADFCKKCKECEPAFKAFVSELKDVSIIKVDSEKEEEMVILHSVARLPTFIVTKDDKELFRCHGVEELKTNFKNT